MIYIKKTTAEEKRRLALPLFSWDMFSSPTDVQPSSPNAAAFLFPEMVHSIYHSQTPTRN